MGTLHDTASDSEQGDSMTDNPLAAIEFMAFIGFALWLFLRNG